MRSPDQGPVDPHDLPPPLPDGQPGQTPRAAYDPNVPTVEPVPATADRRQSTPWTPAGDPTLPAEQATEQQDPGPERSKRIGRIRSALARIAAHDYDDETRSTTYHVRGAEVNTRTRIDPMTGREVEESYVDMPRWPIGKTRSQDLHTLDRNTGEYDANREYPALQGFRSAILRSDYRRAVDITLLQDSRMSEAGNLSPSWRASLANNLLSDKGGLRRDAQQYKKYQGMNRAMYGIVMNPYDRESSDPDERRQAEQEDAINEQWAPQLNLHNIQGLKSFVISDYLDSNSSNEFSRKVAQTTINNHMKSGGLTVLHPTALANYLGVSSTALQEQIRNGGEQVVPPSVLTKINYFMALATAETPLRQATDPEGEPITDDAGNPVMEEGIPDRLADLNDERPTDTSPVTRLSTNTGFGLPAFDPTRIGQRTAYDNPATIDFTPSGSRPQTRQPRFNMDALRQRTLQQQAEARAEAERERAAQAPTDPRMPAFQQRMAAFEAGRQQGTQQPEQQAQAASAPETSAVRSAPPETIDGEVTNESTHFEEARLNRIYDDIARRTRDAMRGESFDMSDEEDRLRYQQLSIQARNDVINEYAAQHNLSEDTRRGVVGELRRISEARKGRKKPSGN